ncbi:MAG: hypothetical protein J0M16_01365 [Gammaproteobacteria bacterium]|nr:hypothetical protein [Gammaproteobacteria bacterium]
MRLSEFTRFPHPVLSTDTGDYLQANFGVEFQPFLQPDGKLTLNYEITLQEPHLQALLDAGSAACQLLVVCNRTYYVGVHRLYPRSGSLTFEPGQLFERVKIRPLICAIQPISGFTAADLHPEFGGQLWSFTPSEVLAYAEEMALTVGQDYLAAVGAIFSLVKEADVVPGRIRIDPEGEQVQIQVHPDTFDKIQQLRQSRVGQLALLSGVYMPAVMQLLSQLRTDIGVGSEHRWFRIFSAKCEQLEIAISPSCDVLDAAQKILQAPIGQLVDSQEMASI